MKKILLLILVFQALIFKPQNSFAQTTAADTALTFVLSNEAPGYLIDNLIANGYGDSSVYSVLVALQPHSGGVISDAFLDKLAACPANSDVFTGKLNSFSDPSNNPVGIGEDGNLIVAGIYGRDYSVMEGYTTYNDTLVPVSLKLFTKAIAPVFYIDAGTTTVYISSVPVTTHYKAFAIGWSLGSTFVLSNEGGLIDDLVRAGHGNKNMVQVMQLLQPLSGGVIPDDFINQLAARPAGSDVLTYALSTFTDFENNPVCINSDGTMHVASIYGKNYFQTAGYRTHPENQQGYTPQLFTFAASPDKYIDAGTGSSNIPGGNSYKAFAIAWSNSTDGIPDIGIKQDTPRVYPNPFGNGLYVMNLNSPAMIEVYNMPGQLLMQTKTAGNGFISLKTLPDGVYWLRISSGSRITQQKIVKHR